MPAGRPSLDLDLVPLNLSVGRDQAEALRAIARARHVYVAQIVREALALFLPNELSKIQRNADK